MRMIVLTILVIALLLIPDGPVVASDLRCGSKLISIGDYRYDVLRKCGEPVHVEVWEEVRVRRDFFPAISPEFEIVRPAPLLKEYVTIEEWEYNLGQGSFIRYLRFENGRLRKITTGDYGY
jgi:hypothetical protein